MSTFALFLAFSSTGTPVPPQPGDAPQTDRRSGAILHPKPGVPTDAFLKSLRVPAGFRVERWYGGLDNPRIVEVGPKGRVYVTSRRGKNVTMLEDTNGDGRADTAKEAQSDPEWLHGIAFDGDTAYVIGVRKLWKSPVLADGTFGAKTILMDDLPDGGQHNNRTIAVRDGKLYISVGSTCNTCAETNPENATMLVSDLDGKNRRIFASGLRNTIGFDWRDGDLYGWDQSIDWLGDEEAREEINLIAEGRRYGWPYLYENDKFDETHLPKPEKGYTLAQWRAESDEPRIMYTAHSAGMQMKFYDGAQFPAECRGDAFVTLRGSWNRSVPSGYEIVRVRFRNGRPASVEPFVSGFVRRDGQNWTQYGRLCGLETLPDGSLLFSDDANGNLYRVSYGAPAVPAKDLTAKLVKDLFPAGGATLSSPDFRDGGKLPDWASDYEEGRAPKLNFERLPSGTKSVVIVMEDPDAAAPKPYVHWLGQFTPDGTLKVAGANSRGQLKYFGPRPPVGDPAHRYHFTLLALSEDVPMPTGFTRAAMVKAVEGKVLGQSTIVGLYERN